MSQENINLVLASNDAYNAGDIDTMLRFYAIDIEAIPDTSVFLEVAEIHGLDAFRAWLDDIGKAGTAFGGRSGRHARLERIECSSEATGEVRAMAAASRSLRTSRASTPFEIARSRDWSSSRTTPRLSKP
jgi:hypothetical protein